MTSPLNRLAEVARLNSHNYGALPAAKSIRVLELQPGADDAPISFILDVVADYGDAVPYHALSYCWGDARDTVEVFCDGKSFWMTQNLHGALKQLRSQHTVRRLWVDAVCINQHEIPERNQQVSIMKQIYANAKRVDVWLGPSNESAAEAVETIYNLALECCAIIYGPGSPSFWAQKLKLENDPYTLFTEDRTTNISLPTSKTSSVLRYFDRPWFSRVWVIQEVQACPDVRVICGEFEIDWEFVALMAFWAGRSLDATAYSLRASNGVRQTAMLRQRLHTRRQVPFLHALENARIFDSTDPRDKVFSLLQHSITTDDHGPGSAHSKTAASGDSRNSLGLRPNYGMTRDDVYRDVAVQSIRQYGSLEVLCSAGPQHLRAKDQPSWIPNWDVDTADMSYPFPAFLYSADARRRCTQWRTKEQSLFVRGCCSGLVSHVSPVLEVGIRNVSGKGWLAGCSNKLGSDWVMSLSRLLVLDAIRSDSSWRRAAEDVDANFADFASLIVSAVGERLTNAFIPLISHLCDRCGDIIVENGKGYTKMPAIYGCAVCHSGIFEICSACYDAGKGCLVSGHELKIEEPHGLQYIYDDRVFDRLKSCANTGNVSHFLQRVRRVYYGNTFFFTKEGWIGSGPKAMRPTDCIAVLFGGQIPFVLRPEEQGYSVIGPCYVFGAMDGEVIEMLERGEVAEEEFELR